MGDVSPFFVGDRENVTYFSFRSVHGRNFDCTDKDPT
jgi:hypothetical protein